MQPRAVPLAAEVATRGRAPLWQIRNRTLSRECPSQESADPWHVGTQLETHAPALAVPLHQAHLLERLQVAGRARLRQSDRRGQLAHAAIGLGEGPDQTEARGDTEAGEDQAGAALLRVLVIHCTGMHITTRD